MTVATVTDIRSANSILGGQSSAGGGNVIDSVTNIAVDGFIDTVVVVSQYLARNLPGKFWDWIAQACTSYEEVLHAHGRFGGNHRPHLVAARRVLPDRRQGRAHRPGTQSGHHVLAGPGR